MGGRNRAMGAWVRAWEAFTPQYSKQAGSNGVSVKIRSREMRSLIQWEANWKTDLIRRVLKSHPGTFFDVGANIGQTLLDYLSTGRKGYVGFEPNIRCVDQLQSIIQQNHLSDCRIIPAGLSDRNGILRLFTTSPADPSGTTIEGFRPTWDVGHQFISCFTLDSILEDLSVSEISLMKIDIEGGELAALRGMHDVVSKHRPWLLCEVLGRSRYVEPEAYAPFCTGMNAYMTDSCYGIMRVQKSLDLLRVSSLAKVAAFLNEPFNPKTPEAYDYLMVPQEDIERASSLAPITG